MAKTIGRLFAMLLMTSGAMVLGEDSREDGHLRIVSYNIRHGRGEDGRIDLDRTAAVIAKLQPDLVALQEVDRNCLRSGRLDIAWELGQRLGLEPRFGAFMDYQGGEYGLAILSRFPILETNRLPLPEGAEPRCALEVTVRARGFASPISFVCIHNDWTSEEIRVSQVESLLEQLATRTNPVILAGDFNGEQTDASMKRLESAGWRILDKARAGTWPSDQPRVEIDFVVLRNFPRFSVRQTVIDERIASDHRPVFAAITLSHGETEIGAAGGSRESMDSP